jgi:hypothetical protein
MLAMGYISAYSQGNCTKEKWQSKASQRIDWTSWRRTLSRYESEIQVMRMNLRLFNFQFPGMLMRAWQVQKPMHALPGRAGNRNGK